MADEVRIGGKSAEEVAYDLLLLIDREENIKTRDGWLNAYSECLQTVRFPSKRVKER